MAGRSFQLGQRDPYTLFFPSGQGFRPDLPVQGRNPCVKVLMLGGKKDGQALTVKVPSAKVSSYDRLFKGEGKLNGKVVKVA